MQKTRFTVRIATILLLFWATGGQWLTLQSVAWVKMVRDYSQSETLCRALSQTFDGDHPCQLCRFIQDQQKQAKETLAKMEAASLFFVVFSGLFVSFAFWGALSPSRADWTEWRPIPLSPPPKVA